MENASKALIIAGAILLAILIIGLGVFIFNQASNTVGETGMDQLAIQKFNAQFERYEGSQSGSEIKQLLKAVIANNYTNTDDDSLKVKVNGENTPTGNYTLKGVKEGIIYTVSFERNPKNGIINNIVILLPEGYTEPIKIIEFDGDSNSEDGSTEIIDDKTDEIKITDKIKR